MVGCRTAQLYNLEWLVNGIVKETQMWNLPIALIKWKKRVLQNTTHSMGTLKIVKNGRKNKKNNEKQVHKRIQQRLPF